MFPLHALICAALLVGGAAGLLPLARLLKTRRVRPGPRHPALLLLAAVAATALAAWLGRDAEIRLSRGVLLDVWILAPLLAVYVLLGWTLLRRRPR